MAYSCLHDSKNCMHLSEWTPSRINRSPGATIQVISLCLLQPSEFAKSIARDPARGGGIDGADVFGGGDGSAAEVRIALADGAQRPAHGLLDQVAWVGSGSGDQGQEGIEGFVGSVFGLY